MIQTSQPEHPIYRQLSEHQDMMPATLLTERKDFGFPPYTRIVELTVKDMFEDRAERMSAKLADTLHQSFTCVLYRPVIDKIADQHIRKIRISFQKDKALTSNKKALKNAVISFEKERKYDGHITIDVDPS